MPLMTADPTQSVWARGLGLVTALTWSRDTWNTALNSGNTKKRWKPSQGGSGPRRTGHLGENWQKNSRLCSSAFLTLSKLSSSISLDLTGDKFNKLGPMDAQKLSGSGCRCRLPGVQGRGLPLWVLDCPARPLLPVQLRGPNLLAPH